MHQSNSVSSASTQLDVNIIIVGGGIAGMWTLARLSSLGYDVLLLEGDRLGCQQTGASQGIIHGGTKYALTGKLTHSSQAIRQMPARWSACLQGVGEIDLRQVNILSAHQYLWSTQSVASRLSGFFASKVMQSRMHRLLPQQRIAPFNHVNFTGDVYQLDEPVLDSLSVLETLRQQYASQVLQFPVSQVKQQDDYFLLQGPDTQTVKAEWVILTAGAGNDNLLAQLGLNMPLRQRRPLQMPMLKAAHSQLPMLYAHCLGASALPRMTITSYRMNDEIIWYLGGDIAEKGVARSRTEQITAAKTELRNLLPWLDFSNVRWSTLDIDRAEPKMPDGGRPAEPYVSLSGKVITAWPVKMAMTPLMVDEILAKLQQQKTEPKHQSRSLSLKCAETSLFPWEKVKHWQA